jgi:hypothetical protein
MLLTLPSRRPQRMWSTALSACPVVACFFARAAGTRMVSPHGVSPKSGVSGASGSLIRPLENECDADAIEPVAVFLRPITHSIGFRGGACHHSAKASRGKDLQIEEPIVCRYSSAFSFHPTLTSVLGPALIRDQVVEVGHPREKRLRMHSQIEQR